MAKYRSIDESYTSFILKEYRYWTLLLNDDQRYLGRAYAWLVREGEMQRMSQLSIEELKELQLVMKEYESVLDTLWKLDHMNYAWLGNHFIGHKGHGHMHIIPRYKEKRIFEDVDFVDGRWGKNYSPHEEFKLPQEALFRVRDILKERLSA